MSSIIASIAYKQAITRLVDASLHGDEEASKEVVASLSRMLGGGDEPLSHSARLPTEFPTVNWNRRFMQLLQPTDLQRSRLFDMLDGPVSAAPCIAELEKANFKSMSMKICRMASKNQQRTLDILRCAYTSLKTSATKKDLLELVHQVMTRLVNPEDGSLDPLLLEAQRLPISVDLNECIKLHGSKRFHTIKDGELKEHLVKMLRDRSLAEWLPHIVATGCAASVHLVRNIVLLLEEIDTEGLQATLRASMTAERRGLYEQLCAYFLFRGERCVTEFVSEDIMKRMEQLDVSSKRPSKTVHSTVKRRRVLREEEDEDMLPDDDGEGDRSDDLLLL